MVLPLKPLILQRLELKVTKQHNFLRYILAFIKYSGSVYMFDYTYIDRFYVTLLLYIYLSNTNPVIPTFSLR